MRGAIGHLRANAVAYVALFVALGGTGYAASQVGSDDIVANAVRSKHIAKGQVKKSDVNARSVSGVLGSGLLGGQLSELDPAPNSSTGGNVTAFGLWSSPNGDGSGEPFGIAVPVRATVSDLHFSILDAQPVNPPDADVGLLIANSGGGGFLVCTIEGGERDCDSGSDRLKFAPGDQITASFQVSTGPTDPPAKTYRFGYRVTP
ncbi:MAG: hypothetical protein ABI726_08305 [bacterium]